MICTRGDPALNKLKYIGCMETTGFRRPRALGCSVRAYEGTTKGPRASKSRSFHWARPSNSFRLRLGNPPTSRTGLEAYQRTAKINAESFSQQRKLRVFTGQ